MITRFSVHEGKTESQHARLNGMETRARKSAEARATKCARTLTAVIALALLCALASSCAVSKERALEACKSGDVKTVSRYLSHGGSVNEMGDFRNTLANVAVINGQNGVLALLIAKGADLNKPNATGLTPLHNAAMRDNVEAARMLLDAGVDQNQANALDRGKMALHYAAIYEGLNVAALLLDRGVDINVLCGIKASPVIWAAYSGTLKSVKFFVSRGAVLNIVDGNGDTALSSAKSSGKDDIYQYLLSIGAAPRYN
jgi:ankyrin repeat protein